MSTYTITRWDVALKNGVKTPIIYVSPDQDFLKFIERYNYFVQITIQGTNTIYDGKTVSGVVDIPSLPNLFHKTGYYTIKLMSDWHGYPHPTKMGTITVNGIIEIEKIQKHETTPINKQDTIEHHTNITEEKKCKMPLIPILSGAVAIAIIVTILVIYIHK